jgi:hypothetical protein
MLLAVLIGSLAALAGPTMALAAPTTASGGCTYDGGIATCSSTSARTETVERTMVGACPPVATGAPNSRARTYVDTYTVTETSNWRQTSDGRVFDLRTVEVGRELVASQLVSDACVPAP